MMMIADALQDLKNLALSGKSLNFAEVAEDYGLNPKLLERKYHESYPNGVAALETQTESLEKQIRANVEKWCKYYNVPVSATKVMKVRGVTYTVLCSIAGAKRFKYAAVSHKDGRAVKLAA